MKIASALLTLIALAALGFGLFFALILALNGFSERDAAPAMIFYIVWLVFFTIALSAGSYFLTGLFLKKSFNAFLALILSLVLSGIVGLFVHFGGLFASTIIASEVRNSYMKKQ
jgi:hypothetical protein